MSKLIKSYLNKFYYYRYLAFKKHKRDVLKNPKSEANRVYYPFFKKKINWNNPKDLIEKTYWLQFNANTNLWTKFTDKYLVRDYIKECGYESLLPELYGKCDYVKDINFDELPVSFILKSNNGCGTVFIVKDKSKMNLKSVKKQLNRWSSITYGYRSAQLHYLNIKPCFIAEELLLNNEEDNLLSPSSLIDYKVYCINGEPEAIWVAYDRDYYGGVKMTMYDLNWQSFSKNLVSSDYYTFSNKDIPKPPCLQEMLDVSRKLSEPFSQVRIDFYVINNEPVFGEMTFTAGWGFFTNDFYNYLGSKITLSKLSQ
jgi:hypothetical protein